MANCYECIHIDACSDASEAGFSSLKLDYDCKHFKNKADLMEVKHGEWKPEHIFNEDKLCFTVYHCSQCKAVYSFPHNYCPCCGAKMDGGKK